MGTFYTPEILEKIQGEILSILDDFLAICREHHLEYYGIAGTGIGAIRHGGFIPWDDDIDLAMPRKDYEKLCRIVKKDYSDRYYMLNAKTSEEYPLMTARLCKRGTVFEEEVMKGVHCPFGIFLDLYPLDNVPDGKFARRKQAWTAWFFSKLMILRRIPRPTLAQSGLKAQLIYAVCGAVYRLMLAANMSPEYLRKRCEAECRRYEGKTTRKMAFLADTNPYWNTIDKENLYPLKKIPFEGRELDFPANIDEMLRFQYGDYMVMPPEDKRKTHTPYRLVFSDGTVGAGPGIDNAELGEAPETGRASCTAQPEAGREFHRSGNGGTGNGGTGGNGSGGGSV